MKHLLAAIPAALLATTALAGGSGHHSYFGRWRIVEIADFAPITAMSDRQARWYVRRAVVQIGATGLRFGGHSCRPQFDEKHIEPTSFLAEGYRNSNSDHMDNQKLKLPDPVVLVDVDDCDASIFIVDRDHIVFETAGVFFRARRLAGRR
jgi:hypothetical protein